ncbi:hypothetical protein E4U59_005070 [Claviceps monticola]|nr:hypothetical protein E4U59_005070 [Claviceps monticola]
MSVSPSLGNLKLPASRGLSPCIMDSKVPTRLLKRQLPVPVRRLRNMIPTHPEDLKRRRRQHRQRIVLDI